MKKIKLWTEYLIEDTIEEIDFDKIIQFSYQLKNIDPGRVVSNNGGWQSNSLVKGQNEEIDKLRSLLNRKIKFVYGEENKKISAETMWININPPGSFNLIHCHLGANYSGVLYLKSEENMGNIYFSRLPNMEEVYDHMCMSGMDIDKFLLEYPSLTGKLYLFSPFIFHSVGVNNSNTDRISISFNYDILRD